MSTLRLVLALACLSVACATSGEGGADRGPGLGRPASNADVARVFWSILPNGENLPPGSGTPAEGKRLFQLHCQSCHGPEGAGKPADPLAGGQGTLDSEMPVKTIGSYWPYATTIFNYTRRAMPFTAPMSLSNDDYYALTAYLLQLNEIIGSDQAINAETLPKVIMPNREGFVLSYPSRPPRYDYRTGR
ncbi:MAG: cytochrome c [Myxococcota bacterium]